MNKKKLIAICIALLAVLLAFAFKWVVLWTYVGVGFAWCGTVIALTGYSFSFARGEQDRSLKYAMVLGGVGMVMTVAVMALNACLALGVAQGGEDLDGALSLALIYSAALLIVKLTGMVCSAVAIAMLPRLRLWIAAVVATNLALTPLVLALLIIFAPILFILTTVLGIGIALNFFLWVGFFIWLYAFYRLNCQKKGSNKGKDIFIIAPVFNIITSVFNFFARILHLVIRIFIKSDPEQRGKIQRRNVWALSLWGDLGRVEIVPPHTNTPWRMSPERYKRICSDVSAVDTVPFEITSSAHGAGEMWYIIPEGGTDFVVLLDKKPIRGKTPINAGNKVALWKRRRGTVIGRLEVKRRILVETKIVRR